MTASSRQQQPPPAPRPRPARPGSGPLGSAWLGPARLGSAGLGPAWIALARPVLTRRRIDGPGEVDLELARRGSQRLAAGAWTPALGPVADHLAAAAAVVVDAAIERRDREAAGGRGRDDCVEAPAVVVDLDDVSGLDALEPHVCPTPARFTRERESAGGAGRDRRLRLTRAMGDRRHERDRHAS